MKLFKLVLTATGLLLLVSFTAGFTVGTSYSDVINNPPQTTLFGGVTRPWSDLVDLYRALNIATIIAAIIAGVTFAAVRRDDDVDLLIIAAFVGAVINILIGNLLLPSASTDALDIPAQYLSEIKSWNTIGMVVTAIAMPLATLMANYFVEQTRGSQRS